MKIGIDARMFSDSFTGIGRYNFELTKRFFSPREIPAKQESRPVGIISWGKSSSNKEGEDIEWVIFMNNPEYAKFDFPNNVRKVLVNAHHYSFAEQMGFLKILNQEKCDLIHFTHFNVPIFYKGPFVVTIHDTTISFYPGKKMNSWWRRCAYNLVIRSAVKRAKKIITVSDNTKHDVVKLFSVPESKIQTIWNGVGEEFREISENEKKEVRKKFGLAEKFLLYTGNWREHKNLVGLLEAFHRIIDSKTFSNLQGENMDSRLQNLVSAIPQSRIELIITGKPDPYYPEVTQTIKKLHLEPFVKLLGLIDQADLVRLYGAATVYVFPSFYEGFGLPPLEAMASGTPAVCSKVSAIPEICGDAVEYFNPHDPNQMAQKIAQVMEDENLRKNLIVQGKERLKLFSWDRAASETLKIYKESFIPERSERSESSLSFPSE